jgi:two-component system C4-dicarboxylate transport response regulator DctD
MTMATILVVDDEPHIRNIIEMKLCDAGYSVRAFANAQAALESFEASPANLVITDHEMPVGISGLDLLRQIRQFDETRNGEVPVYTPIILLTGSVSINMQLKPLIESIPNVTIISKPFSPQNLLRFVRALSPLS